MKKVIDSMTSASGWSVTNGQVALTEWPHLAASNLGKQLHFQLQEGGVAQRIYGEGPIYQLYDFFGLNIASADGSGVNSIYEAKSPDDFPLEIEFADEMPPYVPYVSYNLPVPKKLTFVRMANRDYRYPHYYYEKINFVWRIKFTAKKDVSFFVSEIMSYQDDLSLDLLTALKELLESHVASLEKIQTGTVVSPLPAIGIQPPPRWTNVKYVDSYMVVEQNDKLHMVEYYNGIQDYALSGNHFDGENWIFPWYDPPGFPYPVYIHLPVRVNPKQDDIYLPGIVIHDGFDAIENEDRNDAYHYHDSWRTADNKTNVYQKPTIWDFTIRVFGEARHDFFLSQISKVFRDAFGNNSQVWVNGSRFDIKLIGGIVQIPNDDPNVFLNRISAELLISTSEDRIGAFVPIQMQGSINVNDLQFNN